MDIREFYVYALINPKNNEIFYIGKGYGKRMYKHYQKVLYDKIPHGNKQLFNILNEIIKNNQKPIYKKLFITNNNNEALKREIREIAKCKKKGINLCNLTAGGQGGIGKTVSIETRKKQSDARKNFLKNGGQNWSTQVAGTGLFKGNKGTKHTEKVKRNMSLSHKGKPWSEKQYKARGLKPPIGVK